MVVTVVLLFALFWLPIHILQLWMEYDPNFPKNQATYIYKIIAHALSYANSCVNPFVYSFLGDGFRKAARKAFPKILDRIQEIQSSVNNDTHGARDHDAEVDRGTTITTMMVNTQDPASPGSGKKTSIRRLPPLSGGTSSSRHCPADPCTQPLVARPPIVPRPPCIEPVSEHFNMMPLSTKPTPTQNNGKHVHHITRLD